MSQTTDLGATEILIDLTFRQNAGELQQSLIEVGYSEEEISRVFQTEDKAILKEMMTVLANRDFERIVQL